MNFGPTELILILAIIIILFGVGRIGKIAGELGSGIRSFREGISGEEDENSENSEEETAEEKSAEEESVEEKPTEGD